MIVIKKYRILYRKNARVSGQIGVQPNVFSGCIEMRLESLAAHPDTGMLIQLQKTSQPSAVVIVPVRYNGGIHGVYVYPHLRCIFGKGG